MNDIIKWIKDNNLYFVMGYRLTHVEFEAEIWQVYNGINENGFFRMRKQTRGWFGVGQTMEIALFEAYDKAKKEFNLPPKSPIVEYK